MPYICSQDKQEAFELIKKELISLSTLAYPNTKFSYDVHCDASNIGLGACLVQQGRPIAYASRTLNSAEQNYSTTEKECLPVVWGRIARWIMALQEYQHYTILHKKGTLNKDADALSRIADVNTQTIINHETFKGLQHVYPHIKLTIQEEVQDPYSWNNELLCFKLQDEEVPMIPVGLIEMVLRQTHDSSTAGHFGVEKAMAKIKKSDWTPMYPITPTAVGKIWATDIAILPEKPTRNSLSSGYHGLSFQMGGDMLIEIIRHS
ncbi:hypothetical protein [Parasitella parasitica]|uniref:Reverse transcriptase/retrotransposon-derived protein RNase H-like domain-containing protein n=1 Tax=Parasitella parasitica TaxID=35722 RepID=A0A0B7ND83_9FUNG|nr:hypothetical protein [Parasitella parasitica]